MNKTPPDAILLRIEELQKWQKQQQAVLLEKQTKQRDLLNLEKQKLYEMFGLSFSSPASSINSSTINESSIIEPEMRQIDKPNANDHFIDNNNLSGIVLIEEEKEEQEEETNQCEEQAVEKSDKNYVKESDPAINTDEGIPKRPFLRRGEGLENRFKLDPNKFRLNNLPKYKFANAHKNSKFLKKKLEIKCQPKKPVTELFLKRHIAKHIKKEEAPLIPAKEAEVPKTCTENEYEHDNNPNDVSNDDNVQIVLDAKTRTLDNVKLPYPQNNATSEQNTSDLATPITWAAVLEPTNIQPVCVASIRRTTHSVVHQNTPMREKILRQQEDIDELNVFEMLEIQSCSTESVKQRLQQARSTQPHPENMQDILQKFNTIQPDPYQIDQKIRMHDETTDDSSDEEQHVQFSNEVVVNEIISSESELVTDLNLEETNTKTSTPNTKAFEEFKKKLFSKHKHQSKAPVQTSDDDDDTTLINESNPPTATLQQHQKILKQKLAELETEIELFRNHNAVLTKMKQDHELDKIRLAEEQLEATEKLADERIKLEVYLHDERMKLAEEQTKLEKRVKELKQPNRKEREEVTRLKEQVANLQKDIADRDQKHVAAQGRLRAQLRNAEKEVKDFAHEVEQLKKDNKKLESENVRLRRQSNTKMLNEINKNIAKLAPAVSQHSSPVDVRTSSTLNETRKSSGNVARQRSRTKSVPNLAKSVVVVESSSTATSSSSEESDTNLEELKEPKRNSNAFKENFEWQSQPPLEPSLEQTFKREILNEDGSKDIWYPNGNLKKISPDTMVIRMLYYNKDIKETNIAEGTVKYYYAETNTWHTSYLDGLEILEFPK